MNLSADHLRRLAALDLPAATTNEILIIIAEMQEAAAEKQAAEDARLEKQRIRKARSRDKACDIGGTVTGQSRDKSVTVTQTPPPITPLKKEPSSSLTYVSSEEGPQEGSPEDPKVKLFREGKTILISFGIPFRQTGGLIGRWLKTRNDPEGLLSAIQFARDQNVAEPVAYVSALIHSKGKSNGYGKPDLSQIALDLAGEIRQRERSAGIFRPDDPLGSG